jgi:two-component sensor histidine kinase
VKNNLQVISSLLNLQVSTETSPQSRRSLLESQNRIQSMALVHQLLYQSTDIGRIDLAGYVRALAMRLLRTYSVGPDRIDLTVRGHSLLLGIDRVIPCGLIVNELVANAIDHAFPHERRGHIWVTIEDASNQRVALTVRDDGVGITDEEMENARTFGLQIARTLTHQLDGEIAIARSGGTVVRVTFPVTHTTADTSASATVH